ncbi:serine/threonine protein kinase [Myxococcus stipitatus DSM 14675]|uniref:Serine/threonine protein kinase n=1 Tax=Myxococcus stipitatus (strain DSM 14675 / JCM 12634 / Mx s8) TaxID=1278073 RepID=L7UBV4_MYXSD|nr:serine/threonine-protein kinase [Myxococcus stipitatus]AGC45543.1 serine/threonine protein kinase [Myxococcus stipitatus DSM 14675]
MALQPGDRFGRYELVSWLGRGGMAETWRARWRGDAGVTKSVLIKRVLPEFDSDEALVSMFINEARISASLSHGNIAQVFDFGRVEGQYYLAMELVDGQPLHRVLKRAATTGLPRLPIPLATYIALEMCRGLHYAHTRLDDKGAPLSIVHRDISPDNVLISYEGQVKIVDFGIAKARMARNFKTEPGVVKGKYLFFSPEQARGHEVDARTDVWATGLVLYEMLCGQPPVTGGQASVMMRLANGEFPSPRQARAELPVELDALVMRALSVDVNKRYESANAFADALAGFLYSFAPRFSTMNVAYLVRELFRADMAAEGRELTVPQSFIDELAMWRAGGAPEAPKRALTQEEIARVTTEPRGTRKLQTPAGRKLLPPSTARLPAPVVEPPEEVEPHTAKALVLRGGGRKWVAVLAAAAVLVVGVVVFHGGAPPVVEKGKQVDLSPVTPILSATPESRHESDLRQARAHFDKGLFAKAVASTESCLAARPDHPDCLMISGASLARLERFEEAVKQYQRFMDKHADHPHVSTARTMRDEYARKVPLPPLPPSVEPEKPVTSARPDEVARPPAESARRPSPTRGVPVFEVRDDARSSELLERARTLIKGGKYVEANEAAEKCAAEFPKEADCQLILGITAARLGRIDEGAQFYRRFLELAPADHAFRRGVETQLEAYDASRR